MAAIVLANGPGAAAAAGAAASAGAAAAAATAAATAAAVATIGIVAEPIAIAFGASGIAAVVFFLM